MVATVWPGCPAPRWALTVPTVVPVAMPAAAESVALGVRRVPAAARRQPAPTVTGEPVVWAEVVVPARLAAWATAVRTDPVPVAPAKAAVLAVMVVRAATVVPVAPAVSAAARPESRGPMPMVVPVVSVVTPALGVTAARVSLASTAPR